MISFSRHFLLYLAFARNSFGICFKRGLTPSRCSCYCDSISFRFEHSFFLLQYAFSIYLLWMMNIWPRNIQYKTRKQKKMKTKIRQLTRHLSAHFLFISVNTAKSHRQRRFIIYRNIFFCFFLCCSSWIGQAIRKWFNWSLKYFFFSKKKKLESINFAINLYDTFTTLSRITFLSLDRGEK